MKNKIIFILLFLVSICGLASCKKHTCKFDQEVAEEQFLCKEASCDTIALYYYSCTCGKKGDLVFSYGTFTEHKYDNGKIVGDPILIEGTDEAECSIEYKCTVCEDKKVVTETRKVSELPPVDEPTSDNPTGDEPTTDNPTGDEPTADNPTVDEPTQGGDVTPEQELTLVESLVVDKAYKLSFFSTAKNSAYYFIGTMKDFYGATSTNPAEGVDVKVEAVTGGYSLYFMNSSNVKQYINIETSGTHINFVFRNTASTVWTWDATLKTLVGAHEQNTYFMGTYENYTTFGMSAIDKAQTSYVAQLFIYNPNASGNTPTPDEPTQGGDVTPEQPTESSIQKVLDAAKNLADGQTLDNQTASGTVKSIDKAYDPKYGDITITITDGVAEILAYQVKGDCAATLKVGDSVTITGQIKNYQGTIEFFKAAIILNSTTPGVPETPVVDELKNVVFKDVEEVYVSGKTYSITATNIPTGYTVEYVGNNVTGSGNHLVTAKFYDAQQNLVGTLYAYIKVSYQVEFPEIQ